MKLQKAGLKLAAGGLAILAATLMVASLVSASPARPAQSELWLHVRVDNPDDRGEMVRVNFPVALAEKIVASVDHDKLRHGHINIGDSDFNGVDLRAILDAVKASKDGEFVTVKHGDQEVRVAKQGGVLIVHVIDTNRWNKHHDGTTSRQEVEVHVPMAVVDALVSSGGHDLDVAAALHALAAHGTDTELVSIKDGRQTVRVWLDSKNTSD
jgi:hypothetical protein